MVLGSLIGLGIQLLYERMVTLRRPSSFFGTWKAAWQPLTDEGWFWVTEDITFQRRWGKVFLTTSNNSHGYKWHGKVVKWDERFVSGEWLAQEPGAHAYGTFSLTIGQGGKIMCGYFFGPDVGKSKIVSGFALGRTEVDLEHAKHRLIGAKPVFSHEKVVRGNGN